MKRKLGFLTLVLVNLAIALTLTAPPAQAQKIFGFAIFDCCQGSGQSAYCCENCCWLTSNCDNDDDCRDA